MSPDPGKDAASDSGIEENGGSPEPEKIRDNIKRISEARIAEGQEPGDVEKRLKSAREKLGEVLREEKRLRIERAKLNSRRKRLRAFNLELKRERLEKNSKVSLWKSKIREERSKLGEGFEGEINRLEVRAEELREDLDAFGDTLELHRRDRDRVFRKLVDANAKLQDLLTQAMLEKIMKSGAGEGESGLSRTGKTGLAAELLGRVLVLEKEEAHLAGLYLRAD